MEYLVHAIDTVCALIFTGFIFRGLSIFADFTFLNSLPPLASSSYSCLSTFPKLQNLTCTQGLLFHSTYLALASPPSPSVTCSYLPPRNTILLTLAGSHLAALQLLLLNVVHY